MTLYVGGGVYVNVPPDVYWPIAGVTKPQHLWPFSQSGDYSDKGSVGGLDLTEGGTGNSFDSEGLVLNGSGFASGVTNTDYALGDTYSILNKFKTGSDITSATQFIINYGFAANAENGWDMFINTSGELYARFNFSSSAGPFGTLSINTEYTFILSCTAGVLSYWLNSSGVDPYWDGPNDLLEHATIGNYIGRRCDGGFPFTGKINKIGIIKGSAWSAADAAAIYAGFS